jgi:Glycosyl hydrolases family 2, TIM barrel domain
MSSRLACGPLPSGTEKFLINGRPFYFKGFGRHEDSHLHGRGLDEVLNVKDLNLLQWIGANSLKANCRPLHSIERRKYG